jgi:hypothetical protein
MPDKYKPKPKTIKDYKVICKTIDDQLKDTKLFIKWKEAMLEDGRVPRTHQAVKRLWLKLTNT